MTGCIEKIYSVSALVGSNQCNAKCKFCAARQLRKDAVSDNQMSPTFKSAIKLSARYGGWSLPLTSSGEPLCSPDAITNALRDYQECASQGAYFPNVNLFTNGILLADDNFCNRYLPLWKSMGLTATAVSIHDVSSEGQAAAYGLDSYPDLHKIFDNVRRHGLQCRVTILLRRGGIDTAEKFEQALKKNLNDMCVYLLKVWND